MTVKKATCNIMKKKIHLKQYNRFSVITDIYVKAENKKVRRPGKRHTKLIKLFFLGNRGGN